MRSREVEPVSRLNRWPSPPQRRRRSVASERAKQAKATRGALLVRSQCVGRGESDPLLALLVRSHPSGRGPGRPFARFARSLAGHGPGRGRGVGDVLAELLKPVPAKPLAGSWAMAWAWPLQSREPGNSGRNARKQGGRGGGWRADGENSRLGKAG